MPTASTDPLQASPSFHNYLRSLLTFLLVALVVIMMFRTFSLFYFGDWKEISAHQGDLGGFFLLALRFDLKVLAIVSLLLYWLPLVCISRFVRPASFQSYLRRAFLSALVLLVLLECINLGYRTFFGGPIDVLLFGFLEDDTLAVMSTLLTDWRFLLLDGLFLVLATVVGYSFLYLFRKARFPAVGAARFALIQVLLLVALAILGRGSFDTFPLRSANASVGDSALINSLIPSSSYNLNQAISDRLRSESPKTTKDILREARVKTVAELYQRSGYANEQALIARTTPKTGRLPHVIMVQKEGWSTEIVLGQSERNQVLGEFAKHIGKDHFYRNFFSNAYGTNPTIEALLMNSPITPLSQSLARSTHFAMSNALPFKRAGYRTAFISGGDSAWRNHERFWLQQGFDSYTGRAAIESKYHVDASDNPWGVYEEFVFATVEDAIKSAEADGVPLFAYVLTTNNHSPIRLPKTYQAPPLDPSAYGFASNDAKKITDLTGFHYQTDQFGKFMTWVKAGPQRDHTIVAATGDHVLKGFANYNNIERSYLRYSVPAYFYVPPALDRLKGVPENIAGSHEDIFPTLFELALPDASYFAFGTPLMNKKPPQSYGWVEFKSFIFPEGYSSINLHGFFPWADSQHVLLNPQSRPLTAWQSEVMAREVYRKSLKEWLLWQDYEKQSGRSGRKSD